MGEDLTSSPRQLEFVDRDFDSEDHESDYGHDFRYDHDFDFDHEPMKDFTACDKECGYCGNCDY